MLTLLFPTWIVGNPSPVVTTIHGTLRVLSWVLFIIKVGFTITTASTLWGQISNLYTMKGIPPHKYPFSSVESWRVWERQPVELGKRGWHLNRKSSRSKFLSWVRNLSLFKLKSRVEMVISTLTRSLNWRDSKSLIIITEDPSTVPFTRLILHRPVTDVGYLWVVY